MRKILLALLLSLTFPVLPFAQPLPPDKVYGSLFEDIQMKRIFQDGKTFVDCVPKKDPALIVAEYREDLRRPGPGFSLEKFVTDNFYPPAAPAAGYVTTEKDVAAHIKNLWKVLRREPDKAAEGSSLLPLPYPYIVPGGRFREIYYWDSYFTMLGLKESGEAGMMENMVRNFAYLINTYGHIPNGNRTYYLTRSQPPFFSLMVGLLAEVKGDAVYAEYLPAMEKEYLFWMDGADKLGPGQARRRAVRLKDGAVLNRYWDDSDTPRQESYREDVETAAKAAAKGAVGRKAGAAERLRRRAYRELRAGAESGMDFSSRWFADGRNLSSIETTDRVPVDLNCLLYHLERTLERSYAGAPATDPGAAAANKAKAAEYAARADRRRKAIEKHCWNEKLGMYSDHQRIKGAPTDNVTMAGMYPLFFGVADRARAEKQKNAAIALLLKPGGFVTTTEKSGQQWDAPNGWPPLQWIAAGGLEKYGYHGEARDAALRWIRLNKSVFARTGKLMEKYNVEDIGLEAGGGEYPSQDGFGWTNGVLLKLMADYKE